MNTDEIKKFIDIKHYKIRQKASLKNFLKHHPIFIFLDEEQDDLPVVANYLEEDKTVIYANANPVKMLIHLISRRIEIDLFSDALANDLEQAINTVLKNYNINLEETNDNNIQK